MSETRLSRITVAGHLSEKRGIYQMCFSWKDAEGNRLRKSLSTGLPVAGNKKAAEALLEKSRLELETSIAPEVEASNEPDTEEYIINDEVVYERVKGYLENYRDIYRMRLHWKDLAGRNVRKSFSTDLPVKRGNKRKAEELLRRKCQEVYQQLEEEELRVAEDEQKVDRIKNGDILFADYLYTWLDYVRNNVREITYGGYYDMAKGAVEPYFRDKGIFVKEITVDNIVAFYSRQRELGKKGSTNLHYHAIITGALKHAGQRGLVEKHMYRDIPRPKKEVFVASFLQEKEVEEILQVVKGHKLELGFILGAYYGLRRSEIIGLRWSAINFDTNQICIDHTVVIAHVDGVKKTIASDRTKSKSSRRVLPLIPLFRDKLLQLKKEQAEYRDLCGSCYNLKDSAYIYVDPLGNRIDPNYLSRAFPAFLKSNGLRKVRFHDLRHSCASMMVANGIPLKQIQEWLGHSDFSITANTYAHLEYQANLDVARAMKWMGPAETEDVR